MSEPEVEADVTPTSPGWGRRLLVLAAVLVSCLLLVATVVGVWARNSLLDTPTFTERVGGAIDEPEVQVALSRFLSEELVKALDIEGFIADALPNDGRILAVPLTGAVQEFTERVVNDVLASEEFRTLWREVVGFAHSIAVEVLEGGGGDVVTTADGQVQINLLPVINEVLAAIGEQAPDLLGGSVELPELSADDVPEEARQALGDALGVELNEEFGVFTVYDDDSLDAAQKLLDLVDRFVWLLVIVTPLAFAATLWLASDRRRRVFQLAIGSIVGLVALRRIGFTLEESVVERVREEANQPAVRAVLGRLLDPLLTGSLWLIVAALIVIAVAWATGPYDWAVRFRARAGEIAREAGPDRGPARAWITDHQQGLAVAGAVVGLSLLWLVDTGFIGFLVIVGLVALYEIAVSSVAADRDAEKV